MSLLLMKRDSDVCTYKYFDPAKEDEKNEFLAHVFPHLDAICEGTYEFPDAPPFIWGSISGFGPLDVRHLHARTYGRALVVSWPDKWLIVFNIVDN